MRQLLQYNKLIKTTRTFSLLSLTALTLSACNESTPEKNLASTHEEAKQEQAESQDLAAQFKNPPHDAKPLTWLHAMSGNMSAAGLTKDLEAIAEAGIGGTMLFNVTQGVPLGKVKFNSKEHIDLIGHLASESQRLGLTFGMHNCDGWTSSGGPWITPEHSMKQITFNETVVQGGEINIKLPQPATMLDYYQDVAVIAYPALSSELNDVKQPVTITSSDSAFKPEIVQNNIWSDYSTITPTGDKPAWIQFSYQQLYIALN